jgi:hypothetical protein
MSMPVHDLEGKVARVAGHEALTRVRARLG